MTIDAGLEPNATSSAPPLVVLPDLDFDRFFVEQYRPLVALLAALTGSPAVAEELAQEALLRAHLRWRRVSAYENPPAWVRRVALNLATNHWARRRTEQRLVARLGALPAAQLGLPDPDEEFWTTVRSLPRRQAAAVTLHYLEDRPVAEVAAIMGCAVGTAKAHLHKGRARLAQLLDPQELER